MSKRVLLAGLLLTLGLRAQDAGEILRRSGEAFADDNGRLEDYTYLQTEEVKAYRGKGRVTTESATYEITMLMGRPYERLVAKDGKPLPPKEEHKEQQKMDREFARRHRESAADRAKRARDVAEERDVYRQLLDAYALRLEGVGEISGKRAWVISGEPKPGFRANGSRARLLSRLRGKVWVDEAEYQWVKLDLETLATVSLRLGMVRLAPGARIDFEQVRVNNEVWLPSHIHVAGDARVGYLFKFHGDIDIRYSGYKKFQSDSRVVSEGEPKPVQP